MFSEKFKKIEIFFQQNFNIIFLVLDSFESYSKYHNHPAGNYERSIESVYLLSKCAVYGKMFLAKVFEVEVQILKRAWLWVSWTEPNFYTKFQSLQTLSLMLTRYTHLLSFGATEILKWNYFWKYYHLRHSWSLNIMTKFIWKKYEHFVLFKRHMSGL